MEHSSLYKKNEIYIFNKENIIHLEPIPFVLHNLDTSQHSDDSRNRIKLNKY